MRLSTVESCRLSDPSDKLSGIRQGCLLSPLLFFVVLDALVKHQQQHAGSSRILDYAGEKYELSHTTRDMQLDSLAAESAEVGLQNQRKSHQLESYRLLILKKLRISQTFKI